MQTESVHHSRFRATPWLKLLTLTLSVVLSLVALGCDPYYQYVPNTPANVDIGGGIAAEYAVPREAPQGHVWMESYGVVDLAPEAVEGNVGALHVRAIIANDSDQEWTFDTRQQEVSLDGQSSIQPAFASADAGAAPPLVTVPTRSRRSVDLFYALPDGVEDEDQIAHFDARWHITTPAREISESTPFDRMDTDYGDVPEYDVGPYWGGPYFWYNPLYPRFAFVVGPHYFYGRHFGVRGGRSGFYGHGGFHRGGGFGGYRGGYHGGGGFHGGGGSHGGGGHGGHR